MSSSAHENSWVSALSFTICFQLFFVTVDARFNLDTQAGQHRPPQLDPVKMMATAPAAATLTALLAICLGTSGVQGQVILLSQTCWPITQHGTPADAMHRVLTLHSKSKHAAFSSSNPGLAAIVTGNVHADALTPCALALTVRRNTHGGGRRHSVRHCASK